MTHGPPTPASGSAPSEQELAKIEQRQLQRQISSLWSTEQYDQRSADIAVLISEVRRLEALLDHWQQLCALRTEQRDQARAALVTGSRVLVDEADAALARVLAEGHGAS